MPRQDVFDTDKSLSTIPLESLSIDLQGEALLTVRETMRRTGLAYSSLYEAMRLRGFPRPVKIGGGRTNRWVLREVDAWVAARIAARDAGVLQSNAATGAATNAAISQQPTAAKGA